jgi:hypothetical protein
MSQRFQLNQIVRLVREVPTGRNVAVQRDYEIIRIMPADSRGEISYRIRSGTTERAVQEFEIRE